MPIHLALVALLSLPFHWGSSHAHSRHLGVWTLSVRTDAFSTGRFCSLSGRGIDYQRRAVILHLSARTDTTGAVYRIDGGPPVLARADEPEIVRLGLTLHNDDLNNPSGGLVRIPAFRLLDADSVQVESGAFSHARRFSVRGLRAALDAAMSAGCDDEDFQSAP